MANAKASDDQAVIAHQRLQIAKLTRQFYGQHSKRTVRLLDQMELGFEEAREFSCRGRGRCRARRGPEMQGNWPCPSAARWGE